MKIYTVKEAADFLQISRKKMYGIIREKGFPAFLVGGSYRIIEDDLIEWLRSTKKIEA